MILLAGNVENRAGDTREVYAAPAQPDLALHQLILLVEIAYPLLECLTSKWDAIIDPLVHGEPCIHRLVMHDAIPHRDISAYVVGNRPDHPVSSVDKFTRYISEGLHQEGWIEVFLARHDAIKPHGTRREIDGSCKQNQILKGFTWEERGVHRAHCATHTKA